MRKQPKGWRRVSKSTILNMIIGGMVGCLLSFATTPILKSIFEVIEKKFGSAIFSISTLSIGAIAYAVLEVRHYKKLSKSKKQTVEHCLKVLKSVTPLAPIVFCLQLLFLVSLFFLGKQLGVPTQQLKKPITLVFFCIALPLGLIGWIAVGTWYQHWLLKRTKTIIENLTDKKSGLLEFPHLNDKDEQIRETLYSLKNCHFIFVWAINFSDIIGRDNPNALDQLQKLFENNQKLKLFLLLQCPFCKGIIERAIELDIPYGPDYIEATVESVSNCMAINHLNKYYSQIKLAHREPFIRSILWGCFKEKSPYDDPLDLADTHLYKGNLRDSCLRYMSSVEWGGFLLQEYIPKINGCYSPLYKGSTLANGGLWNRIRTKFAIEYLKGINPNTHLEENSKVTLKHLARDFGMSKRKAEKSDKADLSKFIEEKEKFATFIKAIHDRANTKINNLRLKAGN